MRTLFVRRQDQLDKQRLGLLGSRQFGAIDLVVVFVEKKIAAVFVFRFYKFCLSNGTRRRSGSANEVIQNVLQRLSARAATVCISRICALKL